MVRPRPYLFCRYAFFVDEELLDTRGQLAALQDLQGQFLAHGPTAEREGRYDTVIMRPRLMSFDGEEVLTWSIGQRTDVRVGARYDESSDRIDLVAIDDNTVRYNDFVAVPRLGVVAVDDRSGDRHIAAKGRGAISRLRSAFRNVDGGAVNIEMTTTSADMERALNSWELQEVTFKVRPVNPHSRSELSLQLSEALQREGIGTLRAVAKPRSGSEMRPNEGPIEQALSLTDEGYSQIGVRGVMPDGHSAVMPRPDFQDERSRNQRVQARPRELRVYVETEGDTDEESFANAAQALLGFYDRVSGEA